MLAIRFFACLAASIAGFWIAWRLSHPPRRKPLLTLALGAVIAFVIFGGKILPVDWAVRWEQFAIGGVGGQVLLALCIPVVGVMASEIIASRVVRLLMLTLMAYAFFQQVWFGVLDSLYAVPELHRLQTRFTPTGNCLQSTGYTCGPAAAVTMLKHFGYETTESALGLASETGKFYGTDEFRLARAMNLTAKGLDCRVAQFKSVDDLRDKPPMLLIIKLDADIAHYIAIYKFDGTWVEYTDPLGGTGRLRRENLERGWTGRAILCGQR